MPTHDARAGGVPDSVPRSRGVSTRASRGGLRVLHLSDRWSLRGGADWHLRCVLRALAEAGVDLHLAVGRVEERAPPPCSLHRVARLDDMDPGPQLLPRLDALLSEVSPDVVHVHNALSPAVLRLCAGVGAVMTVQDHRTFCPGRGKLTLDGVACRQTLARERCAGCFEDAGYADRIWSLTHARLESVKRMRRLVVLSRYMRNELVSAGVERARVSVIPPFVEGLGPPPDSPGAAPCVLVAGRLVDAKGVDEAIHVWRASGVDLPLVFAGTGSARARLERQGFEVLGWTPHDRMGPIYARARALLLLPRWQEPFGIAGLEAAHQGVPVVAWGSGGIAEWWPPARALAFGDLDAAAVALRRALRREDAVPTPREITRADATHRLLDLYARLGPVHARARGPRSESLC